MIIIMSAKEVSSALKEMEMTNFHGKLVSTSARIAIVVKTFVFFLLHIPSTREPALGSQASVVPVKEIVTTIMTASLALPATKSMVILELLVFLTVLNQKTKTTAGTTEHILSGSSFHEI